METQRDFISVLKAEELLEAEGLKIGRRLIKELCNAGVIAKLEAGNRTLVRRDLIMAWAKAIHREADKNLISIPRAVATLSREGRDD